MAYPTYGAIRVNNETNTMIEWEYNGVHGEYSQMSWDWEILKSFLMRHNILVTWIACHTERWGESGTLFKVPQFNVAQLKSFFLLGKPYLVRLLEALFFFRFGQIMQMSQCLIFFVTLS